MSFTSYGYGKNNDIKVIAKMISAMQLAGSVKETKVYQEGIDKDNGKVYQEGIDKDNGKVYISLEVNGYLTEEELEVIEKTINVAD